MQDDVTGKDDAITAQAIVIAATHRPDHSVPGELVRVAAAEPLALYIAIKYLQSLPEEDELRDCEYGMKAVLLGRYAEFVDKALVADPSPPDLEPREQSAVRIQRP
jgi:hypothetical protein